MSCGFEGTNNLEVPPGPSHNIIHPVIGTEADHGPAASIQGLPCLEEFCQNTPVINKIYKMLETGPQDQEMLDFLESLESNELSPNSQEECQHSLQDSVNSQLDGSSVAPHSQPCGNPSPENYSKPFEENIQSFNAAEKHDSSSSINCQASDHVYGKAHNHDYCYEVSSINKSNSSNDGGVCGFIVEGTSSKVVYTELNSAIPRLEPLNSTTSQSVVNVYNNSDPNPLPIAISETEIDVAMQSVLNHLGGMTQKEIQEKLDLTIIEGCLEHTMYRHILLCGKCFSVFDALSTFQLHVQTCCDTPRSELKSKMDQNAMDSLARGLWKEVFVNELKKLSNTAAIFKQLDHLHHELDQLWEMSCLDTMVWCRQIFIKAAVTIVTRRWLSTAFANEAHHLRTRTLKAPPVKRPKSEPGEVVEEISTQSSSEEANGDGTRKNPKRRGRPKKQQKSETEVALEALLAEKDDAFPGPSQQIRYTPETPVSEFGFDSGPVSPVLSKRRSKSTPTPEIDFEPEIDKMIREDSVNDELVAAAAQTIEGLDDRGNWENVQPGEPYQLGEDEYVVREILHRRLINDNIKHLPTEEDFEYLVAWEGYGDEENTWEPYDNLKHCSEKLKAFHDRLKARALRKRKGKRM